MIWISLTESDTIPSPSLLLDPERVQQNIDRMVSIVGGPANVDRLRPHLKTHKMSEVVRMQLDSGIQKFKAATLAEAEMAAEAGATDVLIAHQPVGPKIERLARMIAQFPDTFFSAIVDDVGIMRSIAERLGSDSKPFPLFIDVDCGMGRTGVGFGEPLKQLQSAIQQRIDLTLAGLHVYDGHLRTPPLEDRKRQWQQIIRQVEQALAATESLTVVGGGSPTFGLWASDERWECSPGTTLFWDIGSSREYEDLPFEVAAVLLARVISKPGQDRLCLDLGHKAVAAERPLESRVYFPQLPEAEAISQSEEHLVLEDSKASEYSVGDALIGYPVHICPTVALHAQAHLVSHGKPLDKQWRVTARDR